METVADSDLCRGLLNSGQFSAMSPVEYAQQIDGDRGYLSLVTHIPLASFTMSDPTAMANFISEFIGRADKLEEALLGGADVF